MNVTRLEAALEADLLALGYAFETTPLGLVVPITRANRDQLLPGIEARAA